MASKPKSTSKTRTTIPKTRNSHASHLVSLFDNISDALISTDLEFNILEWNAAAEAMYGWTAAEVIGRALPEFVQTQYTNTTREDAVHALTQNGIWKGEVSHRRKDGTWFPIMASVSIVKDKKNRPLGFVSVNRDITERKQAEEQLRQLEERFSKAFDSTPTALALTRLSDSKFEYVNESFLKLAGYQLDEVIGKSPFEINLFTDLAQLAVVREMLIKNKLVRNLETTIRTSTGQSRQVMFSVDMIQIHQQPYSLTTMVDITDRVNAEKRVIQVQRLYAILSQINQTIVRVKSPEDLYQTLCDVVLKYGGITLAWVGLLDSETGDLQPVAMSGMGVDLDSWPLPTLNIKTRSSSNEVIIEALKTSTTVTSADMQIDERTKPLHQIAREFGFRSLAAVPFRFQGKTIGVLNMISVEPDIFETEEERTLLDEMGLDISFALHTFETEKASRLLSSIVESSNDAIITEDLNDIITSWNAAAERIFGYQAAEVIGQPIQWLISPGRRDDEKRIQNQVRQDQLVDSFETVWTEKNGSPIDLSITVSPVKDQTGRTIGSSKILRDITEKKQAEEKKRLAEERYTLLFSSVREGLAHYKGIYEDGNLIDLRVLEINPVGAALSGVPREEQVGKTWREVWPNVDPSLFRLYQKVDETGEPMRFDNDNQITSRSYDVQIIKIAPAEFVATFNDVTERRQSEERFRAAIESAPNAIIMVDQQGQIVLTNPDTQKYFGYSEAELIGKNVDDLVPRRYRHNHGGYREGYYQQPELRPMGIGRELYGLRKDGTEFPVEIGLAPIHTPNETLVMATIVDITERKIAENKLQFTMYELQRSNTELEQFAYVASHDLQEPLRTITGMVQLLRQRFEGKLDDRGEQYINFTVDASMRMQVLINDLLEFSRVDTRGQPFEEVNMNDVLDDVIKNLAKTINQNNALITHDDLPTVNADPSQMTRLFQNLIGNGIKFRTERPPEIHISASKLDGHWQFSVRDNGIGIEPQYFQRIFVIFQRLHTRAEYPGTGIGLALCKKIIERHGGKIWVESEPGNGTTFLFTIAAEVLQ